MKIKVFTLFPEMLRPMLAQSILGRAIARGLIDVQLIDIRDYTQDKHRRADDYPFGGGAGMVMAAQPIVDAFAANLPADFRGRRVYLSPRGRTFTQKVAEELAREDELALLCGHYEGVDQRALDRVIDEEISIGDYVLTGGELGALVVIDAVARLVPGVLGSDESPEDESFTTGLLEYPQYTRPAEFRGAAVPEVLLGGNHADIAAWRREKSLEITLARRPELLETAPLDDADRALLKRLKRAGEVEARLREAGVAFERLEMRLADGFPKRWLAAFVPAENLRAAKKQCLNGRRHAGRLWQAFAMGFIPRYAGNDDALARLRDAAPGPALLFLPADGLLYRLAGGFDPAMLDGSGGWVLTDADMAQTWVASEKGGFYGCERALRVVALREAPAMLDAAAQWFHEKWGVPKAAYLAQMRAYLNRETEYGWYLCLDGARIAGGLGVIENDFHDRPDLAPNVCAVYTETAYRGRGIAGRLLDLAAADMRAHGVSPLYLVTDHVGFYERFGWEFLCMAKEAESGKPTRVYVRR